MFVNILALGVSDSFPVPTTSGSSGPPHIPNFWRGKGPTRRIAFAPLMPGQYSQIFIDFRGIRDAVMRDAGFDYFENSRREAYANRAYCIANPMGWQRLFGATCGGSPRAMDRGTSGCRIDGETRQFYGYQRARAGRRSRWARRRHPGAYRRRSGRCLSRPRSSSLTAEAVS